MSRLYYFASDTELSEQKNPYMELLSVNQALARGIPVDTELLSCADPDAPNMLMHVTDDRAFDYPNFYAADKNIFYDDIGTQKTFCVVLEWDYHEETAGVVLGYIKKQLETSAELEMWSVWLGGELVEAGPWRARVRRCEACDFDLNRLRDFYTDEHDYQCLVLHNEKGGGQREALHCHGRNS